MLSLKSASSLFVACWLCALAGTTETTSQELPVIKVETHLIDMAVSVHDAQGHVVPDLTAANFSVAEDGVPQAIKFLPGPQVCH